MKALKISIRILMSPVILPVFISLWAVGDFDDEFLKLRLREWFTGR